MIQFAIWSSNNHRLIETGHATMAKALAASEVHAIRGPVYVARQAIDGKPRGLRFQISTDG